jgi:hypothetical protein
MMRTVASGEDEIRSGAMKLSGEQQLGVGHEHRMIRRLMKDQGPASPQPTLHRKSMCHSRFPIERKVEDLPRAGVSSVTPRNCPK